MQEFQKKVLYFSLLWRKEINIFCVSSVVVFISDLAFCKKHIKSIVYSLISFLYKKTKKFFFNFPMKMKPIKNL